MGGATSNEGRVEVFGNGQWGTVCDDGWDTNDATVVCRQLGHFTASSAPGQAAFGQGTGPILYDEVDCTGNEPNISACPHNGLGVRNCFHFEDAGAVCASKPYFCVAVLGILLHTSCSIAMFVVWCMKRKS